MIVISKTMPRKNMVVWQTYHKDVPIDNKLEQLRYVEVVSAIQQIDLLTEGTCIRELQYPNT